MTDKQVHDIARACGIDEKFIPNKWDSIRFGIMSAAICLMLAVGIVIVWAKYDSQGLRDYGECGIFGCNREGTNFEPDKCDYLHKQQ